MWFLQPGITFYDVLMRILAVLIIVFFVLPVHEFSHAFVAYKLGDRTAKSMGRLTLNPLAHFDAIGAACTVLFNFGWAKPVPVDSRNFKNPRRDMAFVALAGPLSNILAAIAGGLIINFIGAFVSPSACSLIYVFAVYYISINVGLAVFNLIPLSQLDGFRIMEALIPQRFLEKYYKNHAIISMAIFILLFFGFFSGPLAFVQGAIYNFIIKITSLPFAFSL